MKIILWYIVICMWFQFIGGRGNSQRLVWIVGKDFILKMNNMVGGGGVRF